MAKHFVQALLMVYLVWIGRVVYAHYHRSSSVIVLPASLIEIDGPAGDFKDIVNIVKSVGTDGPGANPISGGGQARSNDGGVKSWNTTVVVAICVCVVFFVSLVGFCLYKFVKRNVAPYQNTSDSGELEILIDGCGGPPPRETSVGNMVIPIQELRIATNNFSEENIIGRGGSATVYKGDLYDGTKIAVKRLESGDKDDLKSEIKVLTNVTHRCLVALRGYCLDGDNRLLAYEYMAQGTLSRFLFDWQKKNLKALEWKQRLKIALDVARGVEYLHAFAPRSFIHRDLKPCNILLDDDMRAKVADFGLARPAPQGEYSYVPRAAGTFGYFAPEYAGMGRVTTKIDVFSFGVILMELITGRKAADKQREECVHLMHWLQSHIDQHTFQEAIDLTIHLDEESLAGVTKVATLAYECCASEADQRPDMHYVVNKLSSIAEPWKPYDPDTDESSIFSCKIDDDDDDDSDTYHSEIVAWTPSEHHPLDDSDSDDSSETVAWTPSERCPLINSNTNYSEIVVWTPSEHYPLDESDTDDYSDTEYSEIVASTPSEHYTLDDYDTDVSSPVEEPGNPSEPEPDDDCTEIVFGEEALALQAELFDWNPSEYGPYDDSDTDNSQPSDDCLDDDSYKTEFDEKTLVSVVELASHGSSSEPDQSHALDVFSPITEPCKPSEPEPEPDDDSHEIDLDGEALACVAEIFSWNPSEHDSDTVYSEIVAWKPSEHFPLDESDTEPVF